MAGTNPAPHEPLLAAVADWTAARNGGSALTSHRMSQALGGLGVQDLRQIPTVPGGPVLVPMLHYDTLSLYNAAMPTASTLATLADLAEDQWGLFTRRQAEATGMAWTTLSRLAAAGSGVVERIAYGVYRLRGAPPVDHLDLHAAWLQLAPGTPAWERTPDTGVVSHRSAAGLYHLGHLPADVHEFILPTRRQSRRPNVRLHRGHLEHDEWTWREGLPVTRPSRIAADLLVEREDPQAVGYVIADALRSAHDDPRTTADALAPLASRYGLANKDGVAVLRWLLDLIGAPETLTWLNQARAKTTTTAQPNPSESPE